MQVGAYAVTDQFAESDPDAVKAFQAAIRRPRTTSPATRTSSARSCPRARRSRPQLAKKIVLPKWTGEVDADSVANTGEADAALRRRRRGEIDTGKLLQGG